MSLASEILAISSLKGYWKMDDGSGTTVNDYAPGNHDGTVDATAKRTAAGLGNLPGKATLFGHQTGAEAVSVTHHADFNVAAAFSWVECVRLWGMENAGSNLNVKFSGFPGPNMVSTESPTGTVKPQIAVYGGNTVCTATTGITDIDQWHLVIRTWNGTTAKIYLDGVDVSGATTPPSPSFADSTEALTFGGEYGRQALAHCALYGKALSTGEVATLQAAFVAEKDGAVFPNFAIGIHQDLNYNGTPGVRRNSITRMRALHATVSRNSMLWKDIEAVEGVRDWARHDETIAELRARDMTPLGVIVTSPTWANGGADEWTVPGVGADAAFTTWLDLYEDFVTEMVTRYADRIKMWEVWNEPNLVGFWSNDDGDVDPIQYRAFYNTIRSAILAVDPTAKVCSAGLASWSAAGVDDQAGETFFRNCMTAGAMTISYAGLHPYVAGAADPDTFTTQFDNTYYGDIRAMRDVLLEFGYDIPIWLTEYGWPSSGGAHTATTQRDRLLHALVGARDRLRDIAEMAVIFIDYDRGGFSEGLFSDMPSDGSAPTAKLAAAAYSQVANQFDQQFKQYRRFFGPLLMPDSPIDLYSPPLNGRGLIRNVYANNPTGSPVTLTMSIGVDAASTRTVERVIPANDFISLQYEAQETVAGGETLQGWASTGDVIVLIVDGFEWAVDV